MIDLLKPIKDFFLDTIDINRIYTITNIYGKDYIFQKKYAII